MAFNPKLGSIDNVDITSISDGELLKWSSSSSKWINATLTELGVATQTYVDTRVQEGIDPKEICEAATTAAISGYSFSSGVFTESSATGALSIDGVTLANGDRVLVKDQSDKKQNGIYVVANIDGSSAVTLTRAEAASTAAEILNAYTFIKTDGTANGSKGFVQTGTPSTINDDDIEFTQFTATAGATTLAGLSDTTISSPSDGTLLQYSSSASKWLVRSLSDAGIATASSVSSNTSSISSNSSSIASNSSALNAKQGLHANLTAISGLSTTDGGIIVGNGSTFVLETAATARTSLGVDAAGTDNSTNVSLATVSGNYLSLSGQEITAGTVPTSLGGTGSTSAPMVGVITAANAGAARSVLGVDAAGTDNSTAVTLATVSSNYLSLSGQEITAGTVPVALGGTGATTAAAARTALDVDAAGTDNSTDVTLTGAYDYLTISGQAITLGQIDLSTDVTGILPTSAGGTGTSLSGTILTNTNLYTVGLPNTGVAQGKFIVGGSSSGEWKHRWGTPASQTSNQSLAWSYSEEVHYLPSSGVSGDVTITLPELDNNSIGRAMMFKNLNASHSLILDPASTNDKIDNLAAGATYTLSAEGEAITLVALSDTQWGIF